mmetsp:Transcript_64924/g.155007  ORF Transcript_64924/g.155007 Transcript_64924/m.155007 type:complete len:220 (+) Transcript_64924:248-907(+)
MTNWRKRAKPSAALKSNSSMPMLPLPSRSSCSHRPFTSVRHLRFTQALKNWPLCSIMASPSTRDCRQARNKLPLCVFRRKRLKSARFPRGSLVCFLAMARISRCACSLAFNRRFQRRMSRLSHRMSMAVTHLPSILKESKRYSSWPNSQPLPTRSASKWKRSILTSSTFTPLSRDIRRMQSSALWYWLQAQVRKLAKSSSIAGSISSSVSSPPPSLSRA